MGHQCLVVKIIGAVLMAVLCYAPPADAQIMATPGVHLIDSITPNTLVSGRAPEPGKPKGKDGLLERIGGSGMIFIPDFSTVLEGNRDKRNEIFAQLRRVYDGRLRKEFGIEGLNTEWSGRLTVGVAVTPEVDRYTSVFGALGERFVLIRWTRRCGPCTMNSRPRTRRCGSRCARCSTP